MALSDFNNLMRIYEGISPEIKAEIEKEVKSYNFAKDKTNLIIARFEGSIAGEYIADQEFRKELDKATTPEERQKVIRDYIRSHIRKEINLEIGNIQREIRTKALLKNGSLLSLISPKISQGKKVDYSAYEEQRKNVLNYLYPHIAKDGSTHKLTEGAAPKSEHWKILSQQAQRFNDGKLEVPQNTDAKSFFDHFSRDLFQKISPAVKVVDRASGRLLDAHDLIILNNIQSDLGKTFKKNLSPKQKIELLEALKSGDSESISRFLIKKTSATQFSSEQFILKGLPKISIDSSGKAVLEGKDVFGELLASANSSFASEVTKNHSRAIQDVQHLHIASNLASLNALASKESETISELVPVNEKNALLSDILSFAGLDDSKSPLAVGLQEKISTYVSKGRLGFGSEEEKKQFLEALQKGDFKFFKEFIKPSQTGKNSFTKLLEEVTAANSSISKKYGFKNGTVPENISALQLLLQNSGNSLNTLGSAIQKNELISDIFNLAKLSKTKGLAGSSFASQATAFKSNILRAVTEGKITFASEKEKESFTKAVEEGNYSYLTKFVTPGMFGESTFSKLLKNVNDSNFEVAQVFGSQELITQSLNSDNFRQIYKKAILDKIIYGAQLTFDSGYFSSEIKRKLKNKFGLQIFSLFDSKNSLKALKKNLGKMAIGAASRYFGLNKEGSKTLETVLDYYSGKLSIGKLIIKFLKRRFGKNLEPLIKYGEYKLKGILKSLGQKALKSKALESTKLFLLKNSTFLKKIAPLFLKKISGPASIAISKISARSWLKVARYAGRFAGSFNKGLDFLVSGIGPVKSKELTKTILVILFTLLTLTLLFIVVILTPMQTILGTFNSFSSTRYESQGVFDINFAGPIQGIEQLVTGSIKAINVTGSVCVNREGKPIFPAFNNDGNWNNLKISDFASKSNNINCKIMCKAMEIMGKVYPGGNQLDSGYSVKPGLVNCHLEYSKPFNTSNTTYWCSFLPNNAYFSYEPGLRNLGRVFDMDKFLKANSAPDKPNSKFQRIEIAAAQDGPFTPYCIKRTDLEKIIPGSILIMRTRTCSEASSQPQHHTELMLNQYPDSGMNIYTISTNNALKKIAYTMKTCKVGNEEGYMFPQKTSLYPCRFYIPTQPDPECSGGSISCDIGVNNYEN